MKLQQFCGKPSGAGTASGGLVTDKSFHPIFVISSARDRWQRETMWQNVVVQTFVGADPSLWVLTPSGHDATG